MDGGKTEGSFSPVVMEVWSSTGSVEEEAEKSTSSLVDNRVVEQKTYLNRNNNNSNNNDHNNKDNLCREVSQGKRGRGHKTDL